MVLWFKTRLRTLAAVSHPPWRNGGETKSQEGVVTDWRYQSQDRAWTEPRPPDSQASKNPYMFSNPHSVMSFCSDTSLERKPLGSCGSRSVTSTQNIFLGELKSTHGHIWMEVEKHVKHANSLKSPLSGEIAPTPSFEETILLLLKNLCHEN